MDPCRRELIAAWSSLLDDSVSVSDVSGYIDERMSFYGSEELVQDGLQLLNDTLGMIRKGDPSAKAWSRKAHLSWQLEVAKFDEDPEAWNRARAIAYLSRTLGTIRPASGRRSLDQMSHLSTRGDAQALAGQFMLGPRP